MQQWVTSVDNFGPMDYNAADVIAVPRTASALVRASDVPSKKYSLYTVIAALFAPILVGS